MSNLAWPVEAEAAALSLLASHGVAGIEVAPTKIAPWDALDAGRLTAFRQACEAEGVVVSSLQAVFFGRPEVALLGDADAFEAMCVHMQRLASIAEILGAGVAVFGAPKSRLKGALSEDDAMDLAAIRLARLGDIAATGGLVLGMEPVPPVYGTDFLNHARDVVEIVTRVDHPNLRAHLDTACVTLGGDDPAQAIHDAAPLLAHYHMAEPQLGSFGAPVCDHAAAGLALDAIGYDRWVIIEMKQGNGDGLAEIDVAIAYARGHYCAAE